MERQCTQPSSMKAKGGSSMLVLAQIIPGSLTNASATFHPGAWAIHELAFRSYREVANLMQKGRCQQARELALAIPMDPLRSLALLLVNYSRRL